MSLTIILCQKVIWETQHRKPYVFLYQFGETMGATGNIRQRAAAGPTAATHGPRRPADDPRRGEVSQQNMKLQRRMTTAGEEAGYQNIYSSKLA